MENQMNTLTFDRLLKYVFGELPAPELTAIDNIVTTDEYYYNLVQNIMAYCEKQGIYERVALEKAIENDRDQLFKNLADKPKPIKETNAETINKIATREEEFSNKKIVVNILLVILLLILFWAISTWLRPQVPIKMNPPQTPSELETIQPPTEQEVISNDSINSVIDTVSVTPPPSKKKKKPIAKENSKINQIDLSKKLIALADANITPLDRKKTFKTTLSGIDKLYKDSAYADVIFHLKDRINTLFDAEKDDYNLLLATSYLFEKQYISAIEILEDFEQVSIIYQARYRWYLALAHLYQKNKSKAIVQLEALRTLGHQPQVIPLLEALKSTSN